MLPANLDILAQFAEAKHRKFDRQPGATFPHLPSGAVLRTWTPAAEKMSLNRPLPCQVEAFSLGKLEERLT